MLRINGRDYELRYPINTLCTMCDAGLDVVNMDKMVINVKTIRELFMYGLRHENKKMTQNQAALGKSLGGGDSDNKEEGK